jgi:phosphatidylglycerophosphate synthase
MSTHETPFDYRKSLKTVRSYPFLHKYIPVDRLIVRPLASLIVRGVYGTGITPNHLTYISFLLSLAAAFVFSAGRPGPVILGGCLALLSDIFDNADGMLARVKGLASRYGAFLDLFLDRIADFAVLTGVTFGIFRASGDPRVLMLGLLTIGFYLLQVGLYYLNNIYMGVSDCGEGAEAKNLAVFAIFVFSVAGWPLGILLGVLAMGSLGTAIKLVSFLRKNRAAPAAPVR